jgi:hypothetical protein
MNGQMDDRETVYDGRLVCFASAAAPAAAAEDAVLDANTASRHRKITRAL